MDNRMIEKIWGTFTFSVVSAWAYFQPVHHLICVLLLVILLNFLAKIARSIKGWKLRRSRKRRFSFYRWLGEVRLHDTLLESTISLVIVMALCVIYNVLAAKEDAQWVLDVTKWLSYIILVSYFGLFLYRVGQVFNNTFIVRLFTTIWESFNFFKFIPGGDKVSDDIDKKIKDVIKNESKRHH